MSENEFKSDPTLSTPPPPPPPIPSLSPASPGILYSTGHVPDPATATPTATATTPSPATSPATPSESSLRVRRLPEDIIARIAQHLLVPRALSGSDSSSDLGFELYSHAYGSWSRSTYQGHHTHTHAHTHEGEKESQYEHEHEHEYEHTSTFDPDFPLLASYARAGPAFRRAAARVLYARVVLHVPASASGQRPSMRSGGGVRGRGGLVLDLKARARERDAGGVGECVPKTSNFESALLPHNAPYVVSLRISGHISPRPPPRNTLPSTIAHALRGGFPNLASVQLTPTTYGTALFAESVPLLAGLHALRRVCLGAGVWEADVAGPAVSASVGGVGDGKGNEGESGNGADALVRALGGEGEGAARARLAVLELVSPSRRILELLPGWLGRLEHLTELHLTDNCGSVTPGVLRALAPHLSRTLRGLTLGLSYSLANEDVFDLLSELAHLERLALRYYLAPQQLKPPASLPALPALRAFTASYDGDAVRTRRGVARLDKWVRWVVGGSPRLRVLCLRSDGEARGSSSSSSSSSSSTAGAGAGARRRPRVRGAHPSHDALAAHIVAVHARSLRVLDLLDGGGDGADGTCLRKRMMERVLERCEDVEEIRMRVSERALLLFANHPFDLPKLRFATFEVCNGPRRAQAQARSQLFADPGDDELLATNIIQRYRPSLRWLSVNGVLWEAVWAGEGDFDDAVYLDYEEDPGLVIARRVEMVLPPWDRR